MYLHNCLLQYFHSIPCTPYSQLTRAKIITLLILGQLLFFLCCPLCRGEADLLVTAKYGYFRNLLPFIGPCCWPFLYIFLPPLPFSDRSSYSPLILAVVFLVFWNLLVSLSRFFSVVYHHSFGPCVQPISSGS